MNTITTITDNLELWTSALLSKSTAGRGSNGKLEAYGIKKLRELILELAVRGKLVPQDPEDEDVRQLLTKNDKCRHEIAAIDRRADADLQSLLSKNDRWEIPKAWSWRGLADLVLFVDYRGKTPTKLSSGIRLLTAKNVRKGQIDLSPEEFLSENDYTDWMTRGLPKAGDVLFTTEAPMGNAAVVKLTERFALAQRVICFQGYGASDPSFLVMQILSTQFQYILDKNGTGMTAKGIKASKLKQLPIAIPPLAEQHRIVAKVDELMTLCDQLEQQQTNNIEAHQTLVGTLLGTLTSIKSPQELTEAWNRIADYFDTLFTTEQSIDQLKQTILQLAVMGKLVPQDPNDEPASMLLEKIAREKLRLVKKGEIKKNKPLPGIETGEKIFEVPTQWQLARFGWLVNFKSELVKPEDFADLDQVAPDSIEKGTGKLLFRRTVSESGIRGPNNRFYAGQILYSKIRPSLSKAIIAPFDGLCSADMYPLESMIDAAYLLKTILSEPFLEQVRIAENRIKMPKLNVDSLSLIVVPVPPLAEQHRIVAKVDELMALCDTLKARLTDAQTTQIHLADAIVEQAVA